MYTDFNTADELTFGFYLSIGKGQLEVAAEYRRKFSGRHMDPMIRKLVSLKEECEKKGIPDFVTSGIDDAMRLFEVNTHWRFIFII